MCFYYIGIIIHVLTCRSKANYFAFACLQFTSVGSTTILTSTSGRTYNSVFLLLWPNNTLGVWTLIFGAIMGVEKFTVRKLLGVLASLTGIILISRVDISGKNDDHRGSFPHKSTAEIVLGNSMAAFSAILYGVYTIVMKRQVGDESRVDMKLFFGLVGLWNTLLLWPGFFILHSTGFETFMLPEAGRIWTIILVRAHFFLDNFRRTSLLIFLWFRSMPSSLWFRTFVGRIPCCSPPRSSSPSD